MGPVLDSLIVFLKERFEKKMKNKESRRNQKHIHSSSYNSQNSRVKLVNSEHQVNSDSEPACFIF